MQLAVFPRFAQKRHKNVIALGDLSARIDQNSREKANVFKSFQLPPKGDESDPLVRDRMLGKARR
jgi:hypothetical protein